MKPDLISNATRDAIMADGPITSVLIYEDEDGVLFTTSTGSKVAAIGAMKCLIRKMEFDFVMGFSKTEKEQQGHREKEASEVKVNEALNETNEDKTNEQSND